MQGIKTALDSALGQAQHQWVKDKIQAMDTDINTVLTGLQAIEKGDTSQLSEFTDAAADSGQMATRWTVSAARSDGDLVSIRASTARPLAP